MDDFWITLARGADLPDDSLARAAEVLVGPVYRLAWVGADEASDRARARARLDGVLARMLVLGGEAERLARLADWFLQATFGDAPLGLAYQIDDHLPGWLGLPARAALEAAGSRPALRELRRPVDFARARQQLRELLEHAVTLKKTPGPELYREARDDAFALLNAAEHAQTPPPRSLKLLQAAPEDWASESRSRDQLERGLKVWNSLVKHLRNLQAAATVVVSCWTDAPPPAPLLERDWERRLAADFPTGTELARALVHDLAVCGGEEPELPRGLSARWLLGQLEAVPAAADLHDRVALLGLVREATGAEPTARPPVWEREARAELDRLRAEVRALRSRAESRGIGDAVAFLDEGLGRLEALDSREAEDWIRTAAAELDEAARDEQAARLEAEAARLLTDLQESGCETAELAAPAPGDEAATAAWHGRVRGAWDAHYDTLRAQVEATEARVGQIPPGEPRDRLAADLEEAWTALEQRSLGRVSRACAAVDAALAAIERQEDERFGPVLRDLAERARRAPLQPIESASVEQLLLRIRARAAADLPYADAVRALDGLLGALERQTPFHQPVLCLPCAARPGQRDDLLPVCWVDAGVVVDPRRVADAPSGLVGPHDRSAQRWRLVSILDSDGRDARLLAGRFRPVLPVRSLDSVALEGLPPALDRVSGLAPLFVVADGEVQGPYRRGEQALVPADRRGFVVRMEAEQFWALFGRVEVRAPDGGVPWSLVVEPPDLDDLLEQGGGPVDRLDAAQAEVWLDGLLGSVEGVDVAALAGLVERYAAEDLPEPVLRQRIGVLGRILETARLLERERRRAAEAFLATPEGRREIERAAVRALDTRREQIEREVETLRRERMAELQGVLFELESARTRLERVRGEEEPLRAALEGRLARLRADVAAAEELLGDSKARLLVELLGDRPGGAARSETAADEAPSAGRPAGGGRDGEPLRAPALTTRPVPRLADVVTELSERLSGWPAQDVANLLLALMTGPWTLLAGPPGVGKSTVAREVLTGLGYGPASPTYLEVVVHREWQDDAALFGFWHPQQRAWVPGSEGLLDLVLRARDDAERGQGGLYPVLFEELNLASPEYYLSRLISAFEARTPQLRLYGDDLAPRNTARYPATVPLGSNVRILATVNVDETVERLSPRFLSRCSVLWVEPAFDEVLATSGVTSLPASRDPMDWRQLATLLEQAAAPGLGPLEAVARFLHDQRVPGAPSPRTIQAMRRYLGASRDVLPETLAQDYLVLQRLLPPFRAVGPRYREVLDELVRLLRRNHWYRSAARCEALRARGEELGDYYDFFHA